jgi:hypothetical protein
MSPPFRASFFPSVTVALLFVVTNAEKDDYGAHNSIVHQMHR